MSLRGAGRAVAGTNLYEGDHLVTPWHNHDLHQLEYAAEGVVEVETASGCHLLPPRQAAWIPAGVEHQTTIATAVRTIAVLFDPAETPMPDGGVRVVAVSPLLREMVLHAVRWPIDRPIEHDQEDVAGPFFGTLGHLVREALALEAPLCLPSSADPLVSAAMSHTRANVATVTMAVVARAVGVSERTLRRRFVDDTGMAWRTYLTQARLLRAAALLSASAASVLDIAVAVGFEDASAFSRAFARHCGESPSKFRARTQGDCP